MTTTKKRFFSLVATLLLVLAMTMPAFAENQADGSVVADVTVVNMSKDISAQELQEIVEATGAYLELEDGKIIPVDTIITVEDVSNPSITRSLTPGQQAYSVTVSATASEEKIVNDSGYTNENGVNVAATLQLVWIDNMGLNNIIKEVSGTLTVLKGTITEATVQWGNGNSSAITWDSRSVGSASSFSYTPNKQCPSPKATYQIIIAETFWNLFLTASASIFQ